MGGPDSNGISRAPLYLGLGLQRDRVFVYAAFTLCGSLFQHDSTNSVFSHSAEAQQRFPDCPATPYTATAAALHCMGLGWPLFAHHYWGGSLRFLFLRLLRCFTSPGSSPLRSHGSAPVGLPHSDIRGSRPACGSPRRFAACCVFRRL